MFQMDETRKIDAVFYRGKNTLEIRYHPPQKSPPSPFSKNLKAIAGALAKGRDNISLLEGDGRDVPDLPAITLHAQGRGAINYLALPEGLEFSPFLLALSGLEKEPPFGPEDQGALAAVEDPAKLHVFVANTCPHCPNAAREAIRIALASEKVDVSIIDVQHYPKLAEQFQIKSVPFSLLDGKLSWTGVKAASQIISDIARRNEVSYPLAVFQSLIDSGRLDQASGELLGPEGVNNYVETWKRSTTSSRIGLLLTAEQFLETTPRGLDNAVMPLVELLSVEDAALRGDTADLLGRIGRLEAIPYLEKLKHDSNPDVAEIAEEAIEEINND